MEILKGLRRSALRYTVHKGDLLDEDDSEDEGDITYTTKIAQKMNQSYKHTIIRKPVINSLDELKEDDKVLSFISKCYGDWPRDDENSYAFAFLDKKICPLGKSKTYHISPSNVRLDTLMKNAIIKKHFEKHGYATDWKPGKYILHPEILMSEYTGEIGEEAFLALVLAYTDCEEGQISHLEGKDYEIADFVIKDEKGNNRIAFDVKNMNPKAEHNDAVGDMKTSDKRKLKTERLKCELITVNMLEMKDSSLDETHEILGLIDEDGNIIPRNIERLKTFVNGK